MVPGPRAGDTLRLRGSPVALLVDGNMSEDVLRVGVGVVHLGVQVRVHCAEQRLQGEDSDLHQTNPSYHRVDLSRAEQGLGGWLFSRVSAGGDENCSELCQDDVHQVLGYRAWLEEQDQRVRGADKAQHGQARTGLPGGDFGETFHWRFFSGSLSEEGEQPVVCPRDRAAREDRCQRKFQNIAN